MPLDDDDDPRLVKQAILYSTFSSYQSLVSRLLPPPSPVFYFPPLIFFASRHIRLRRIPFDFFFLSTSLPSCPFHFLYFYTCTIHIDINEFQVFSFKIKKIISPSSLFYAPRPPRQPFASQK